MTKKDIAILLSPTVMFLTVAVTALFVADLIHQRVQAGDGHEKFETFVQNVKNGKWQLTTDRWLVGMQHQQVSATSYLDFDAKIRESVLWLGWASLLGIIFQIAAVLYVRKRFIKL